MINRRKWKYIGRNKEDPIENIALSKDITDMEAFLNPKIEDLYDFSLIGNLDKTLNRIKLAIEKGETIVLEHDYDADGIGGASAGYLMLKELGAKVVYRSNNRFEEGYGMCIKGVDEVIDLYGDNVLIITIDNGISQHEAIAYAKDKGIDVIVTDHHEAQDKLPDTSYIVNPKVGEYPFKGLCGAAVIWKLLTELYPNKEQDTEKYLDIVALSTVADVVPLLEENRVIVTRGLELISEGNRLFFRVIREVTDVDVVNSFTLGFIYGPVLNAIGRLTGKVDIAVEALVSDDGERVREIVEELVKINNERKEMSTNQTEVVREHFINMSKEKDLPYILVYQDDKINQGVAGIVAGRVKEEFNRPAVVFSKEENGIIKASGRSIAKLDMMDMLKSVEDIIIGYGGHDVAAGLSIYKKDLEEFIKRVNIFAKDSLSIEDLIPVYEYVHSFNEKDITLELIRELDKLEPYGEGFPKPLFKICNFSTKRHTLLGKNDIGLKLMGEKVDLLAWNQADVYKDRIKNMNNITALGFPNINEWKGNVYLQFMVDQDNYY